MMDRRVAAEEDYDPEEKADRYEISIPPLNLPVGNHTGLRVKPSPEGSIQSGTKTPEMSPAGSVSSQRSRISGMSSVSPEKRAAGGPAFGGVLSPPAGITPPSMFGSPQPSRPRANDDELSASEISYSATDTVVSSSDTTMNTLKSFNVTSAQLPIMHSPSARAHASRTGRPGAGVHSFLTMPAAPRHKKWEPKQEGKR